MITRIKHLKRGTTYRAMPAQAQVSSRTGARVLHDTDAVTVYQDEKDGKIYVRFPDEIGDPERFESLPPGQNPYQFYQVYSHPIAEAFYRAMTHCETLGASPALTQMTTMLSDLRHLVEKSMNDIVMLQPVAPDTMENRYEVGFRNIVTHVLGPDKNFEIDEIVDFVTHAIDAAENSDVSARGRMFSAGEHLHKWAKDAGWPDDGEGAFEYVQRISYEQGLKDARANPEVSADDMGDHLTLGEDHRRRMANDILLKHEVKEDAELVVPVVRALMEIAIEKAMELKVPAGIPKLENCGTYYAQDNKGNWHYINHANTWQGFAGPLVALDDPAADATDGAHPAWWRGDDHGYEVMIKHVNRWLDGGSMMIPNRMHEPMQNLRNRIHGILGEMSNLQEQLDNLQPVAEDEEIEALGLGRITLSQSHANAILQAFMEDAITEKLERDAK